MKSWNGSQPGYRRRDSCRELRESGPKLLCSNHLLVAKHERFDEPLGFSGHNTKVCFQLDLAKFARHPHRLKASNCIIFNMLRNSSARDAREGRGGFCKRLPNSNDYLADSEHTGPLACRFAPAWAIALMLVLAAGACSRNPQSLKARHLARGDEYAAQKKFAEAAIEYRNAVQAVPQDGDVRIKLADALWEAGELGKGAADTSGGPPPRDS